MLVSEPSSSYGYRCPPLIKQGLRQYVVLPNVAEQIIIFIKDTD